MVVAAAEGRTNLLIFVEPPSADPHARWCGEGARQRASLPDLAIILAALVLSMYCKTVRAVLIGNENVRTVWVIRPEVESGDCISSEYGQQCHRLIVTANVLADRAWRALHQTL